MLRRAPARIEGENYGQEGQGKSFLVADTNRLSKYYRQSEPVTVNSQEASRRRSDQHITLSANEWTAYRIGSKSRKNYRVTVRVKAASPPAEAQLIVGSQVRQVAIGQNAWKEIKLDEIALTEGTNRLRWLVTSGIVDLDWLELGPAEESLESASRDSSGILK